VALPESLQAAVELELAGLPPKRLKQAAAVVSARYRSTEGGAREQVLLSPVECLAYAAYRLPATFAATRAVLEAVSMRLPEWAPVTILDVGAGPGSATWAAADVWSSVRSASLLERDEHMIELGRRLTSGNDHPLITRMLWTRVDLPDGMDRIPHDLVLVSYLLGELSEASRSVLTRRLWDLSTEAVVVVEPGTPAGFARIRLVRDQLIALGANIIAPCPHHNVCPMTDGDWCHFAERTSRTARHRKAKGGRLGYEDEKYAYVAAGRSKGSPIAGRVIRHPQSRTGHIYLDLCTLQGLERRLVSRRDKDPYRQARNAFWGSALE
jgi:ribosomal protein RSM22 (predicted rRNA methylase)